MAWATKERPPTFSSTLHVWLPRRPFCAHRITSSYFSLQWHIMAAAPLSVRSLLTLMTSKLESPVVQYNKNCCSFFYKICSLEYRRNSSATLRWGKSTHLSLLSDVSKERYLPNPTGTPFALVYQWFPCRKPTFSGLLPRSPIPHGSYHIDCLKRNISWSCSRLLLIRVRYPPTCRPKFRYGCSRSLYICTAVRDSNGFKHIKGCACVDRS